METKQKIYRVVLTAEPTLSHPNYYEVKCAALHLWLAAEYPDAALQRATLIAAELPYKLDGRHEIFEVFDDFNSDGNAPAWMCAGVLSARLSGFAFYCEWIPTGSDGEINYERS